jgi:hypothetical protein
MRPARHQFPNTKKKYPSNYRFSPDKNAMCQSPGKTAPASVGFLHPLHPAARKPLVFPQPILPARSGRNMNL